MSFITSESGAVTVDWVVLTGALVGLGLAVSTVVSSGVKDLTTDVDQQLHKDSIITTQFYADTIVSVSGSNGYFATPRCQASDSCYAFYGFDIDFEGSDGTTYTADIHAPSGEFGTATMTITDDQGNEVDPTSLNFADVPCTQVEVRGRDPQTVCTADYL